MYNLQKLWRAFLWALRVQAKIMIVKLSQDRNSLGRIIQGRISCCHAMFLDNRMLLPLSVSPCQIFHQNTSFLSPHL